MYNQVRLQQKNKQMKKCENVLVYLKTLKPVSNVPLMYVQHQNLANLDEKKKNKKQKKKMKKSAKNI